MVENEPELKKKKEEKYTSQSGDGYWHEMQFGRQLCFL